MALYYLAGDMSKRKKKKQSSGSGSSKSDKKKTRRKKVAKIGLAPSRAAFLAVVDLNAVKLANKLARIYKADGGKEKLKAWWEKFGGDFEKLKKAISKGTKQQINGDAVGIVLETAIATATPIIIASVPLIKMFKAGGDASEMRDFDSAIDDAKKTLRDSDDFEKASANMRDDQEVGRGGDGGGGGEASFFSPLGLTFKLAFLAAVFFPASEIAGSLLSAGSLVSSLFIPGFIKSARYGKENA